MRFAETSRLELIEIWEADLGTLAKEVDKAKRYFARASLRFGEGTTLSSIHLLAFYSGNQTFS